VKATGKEPLELLAEIPHSIMHANPEVLLLGLGSVLILLLHPRIKLAWVKQVPAQVFVLLFAVPLGLYFDMDHAHDYLVMAHHYHVGPEYLVTLPASLLDAITFPDFSMISTAPSIKYIVMFTLVGSIESVLSTLAVDSLDPKKRASNLNKDLLATGLGNLLAASIGGLPMISEIVRSKANIDAGATSQRANFSHGVFLAVAVGAFPGILHEIPLAALAAMLVFTGARLASFREFTHAKAIGTDQLMLFMTTLVVTLATDLLVGVAAGLVLKMILHWLRGAPLTKLFSTKVESTRDGSTLNVTIRGAAAFTALLKLRKHLIGLGADTQLVRVNLTEAVLVDHTFLHRLETMSNEWEHTTLELVGVDSLLAVSDHPHSTRRRA
jgi:MFS superfamily sulfate permease-like transporter